MNNTQQIETSLKSLILDDDKELVAKLSFGFWTSLFESPYAKQMRTADLKRIFSNLPPKDILEFSKRVNNVH